MYNLALDKIILIDIYIRDKIAGAYMNDNMMAALVQQVQGIGNTLQNIANNLTQNNEVLLQTNDILLGLRKQLEILNTNKNNS